MTSHAHQQHSRHEQNWLYNALINSCCPGTTQSCCSCCSVRVHCYDTKPFLTLLAAVVMSSTYDNIAATSYRYSIEIFSHLSHWTYLKQQALTIHENTSSSWSYRAAVIQACGVWFACSVQVDLEHVHCIHIKWRWTCVTAWFVVGHTGTYGSHW